MRIKRSKFYVAYICLALFGYPLLATTYAVLPILDSSATILYRLALVIIVILLLFITYDRLRIKRAALALIAFVFIYFFRIIYDGIKFQSEQIYMLQLYFMIFILPICLSALIFGTQLVNEEELQRISILFLYPMVVLLCILWKLEKGYNPWEAYGYETTRFGLEELNPISVAFYSSWSFFLSLIFIRKNNSIISKLSHIVMGFIALSVVMAANSRGPTIAMLICSYVYLRSVGFGKIHILVSGTVCIFVLFASGIVSTGVVDRFIATDLGVEDLSVAGRLIGITSAIEGFLLSPIHGAYAYDPSLSEDGFHPHNIFLETAMALGIVGLVPLLFLVILALRKIKFLVKHFPAISLMYLSSLVVFQFSGSIPTASHFFLLFALVISVPLNRKRMY